MEPPPLILTRILLLMLRLVASRYWELLTSSYVPDFCMQYLHRTFVAYFVARLTISPVTFTCFDAML